MRECVCMHVCVPVLYEVLHVEVIDEQRIPQLGVLHGFVQRKT